MYMIFRMEKEDVSHGSLNNNTANNMIVRSIKPSSRILYWYISFLLICIIFNLFLYFYFLPKNRDNFKSRPSPKTIALYAITRPEQLYKKILQKEAKLKEKRSRDRVENFRIQWYRQRRSRVDWQQIVRPCLDNRDWGQVKPGWDKSQRSNANRSTVYLDVRPAREFTRIVIQSRTKDGKIKSIGGDTWRFYLRGPSSIASSVIDHNNGTYEALFLVMEPGIYKVEAYLDFSLCDGFRDPPIDWFIRGNSQGKFHKDGIIGQLDEYIHETFDKQLSINVPKPRMTTPIESILSQKICREKCDFLFDGYGRWVNNTWIPFLNDPVSPTLEPGRPHPSGVLISYGDSLGLRFGASLANNQKTCGQLYKSCSFKYNWIYPVGSEEIEKRKDDDLDFDEDRVISYIRKTLETPQMNTNDSTLVLNIGLHYVMALNFTTYQHLINRVIGAILERQNVGRNESELRYKARVVWKTTAAIKKENALAFNITAWRFFTTQRILLFNAYAASAMCKAGIPILDVHPLTDSYVPGPFDVVHYPNYVFSIAEKAVADFKTNELNGKKRVQRHKATKKCKN